MRRLLFGLAVAFSVGAALYWRCELLEGGHELERTPLGGFRCKRHFCRRAFTGYAEARQMDGGDHVDPLATKALHDPAGWTAVERSVRH